MSRFAATTWTIALLTVLAGRDMALAVEIVGCETGKLLASDADALDGFGEHLSVRGDVAVVGAWNDEENSQKIGGFSFGSAYVLRQVAGEWVEEQKLLPSDPVSELRFGHDVAIHGNRLVVGAVGSNGYTGAVYFYEFDSVAWGNEQKLEPATALFADEVGVAVAIDGDVAVAGAPGDDTAGGGAGTAYVFRNVKGVWVEEQKIMSVRIRSDLVLVPGWIRSGVGSQQPEGIAVLGDGIGRLEAGPLGPAIENSGQQWAGAQVWHLLA